MPPADGDMLRDTTKGDSRAFSEVVDRHKAMVFSLALHYLHDRAHAEDMAQEVFLELYRSLGRIRSERHLVFWLRRVTCHRCIDWSRRRGAWNSVSLDEVSEIASPARSGDPLLRDELQRLVASLPPRLRLAVTLRYQEDLDPADIAAVLEMPVNTVKSHLHRALVLLQAKISALERAV